MSIRRGRSLAAYNKKLEFTGTQAVSTYNSAQSVSSPTDQAQAQTKSLTPKARVFNFVLNALSTLTAVFVFFLYVEMSELTLDGESTRSWALPRSSSQRQVRDAFNQKAIFACVAFLVICVNASSFILQQKTDVIVSATSTIIACGSGIVMALVVGRLDSKFLDPGTWVVAILYLYAVIQPVAIYFQDDNARFYATTSALFLKAFLWLVFYWAFTDGRLWSYVVAIRKLLLGETHNSAEVLGT